MTKVTAKEVKQRLDAGDQVTVVDSRADQVWNDAKTKAAGAIRVPPNEIEDHIAGLSRGSYIVIYCT